MHGLQHRRLGMGDVLAVVAADTDCGHAVEVAIAVAYCVKIEDVEGPVSGIAVYQEFLGMLP